MSIECKINILIALIKQENLNSYRMENSGSIKYESFKKTKKLGHNEDVFPFSKNYKKV